MMTEMVLRAPHLCTILGKGVIGRKLVVEHGKHLVVICIQFPVVESECGDSTLVAHVEYHIIVYIELVMQPSHLWYGELRFAVLLQQHLSSWH